MGDLVFGFTLGAHEGLRPKVSNHVRRSISSHIPPLGGPQSTSNWSFACRWPKSFLRTLGQTLEAPSYPWALSGAMWTFRSTLGEGFKEVGFFFVYKTFINPKHALWGESERIESIPCLIRGTKFPCTPPFSVQLHLFCLSLLPSKGIQQSCLDGNFGKAPTWSTTNDSPSLHNLACELCNLIILWCSFSVLHHKGLEGVEECQKCFGHLVHSHLVHLPLLCLKSFVFFWMFQDLLAPYSPSLVV
jgi:hypothetical protein